MTILAAEAVPAAESGGAAAAGGGLSMVPIGGGDKQPHGSSVAFAIAVLLIGLACMGLWIAFHKAENAETGGFPGLFGQMLQWVHAGETSEGAAAAASTPSVPESEVQKIKNLPSSVLAQLEKLTGNQFVQWFLHL